MSPASAHGNARTSLWRALRLMLSGFLLFVAIIVVRSINWEHMLRSISATKTGIEHTAKPESGNPAEPAKRKNNDAKPKPKKVTEQGAVS